MLLPKALSPLVPPENRGWVMGQGEGPPAPLDEPRSAVGSTCPL